MRKIINATLIMVLFLIAIVTVSSIRRQNTSYVKTLMVKNDYTKNMENLKVENDLQRYGIEVVAPTDVNFAVELKRHIGDSDMVIPLVEAAKPLALFIKNNSSKEIIGVSFRWKFIKSDGKSESIPQIEMNPGVLMGLKPRYPQMVGKTGLVNRNETRFFSYFNMLVEQEIVNASIRARNPNIKYPQSISVEETQRSISSVELQKNKMLSDISDISVSVDGIFFNDGTFIGEDRNFLFDSTSGRLQARKDFLAKLREAKSSGKEDSEIFIQFLAETPNMLSRLSEMRLPTGYANSEEAFDLSYQAALINLRKEIEMKRSKMSDSFIINDFQTVKESDFITLRKANQQ